MYCTAHTDCHRAWPRDPVLEVECPVCHQPPGSPCVVRAPSEHVKSAKFCGLPPWGHDERDLAAVLAGAYGECPSGRCGLAARAQRLGLSLDRMVEVRRGEIRKSGRKAQRTGRAQAVQGEMFR